MRWAWVETELGRLFVASSERGLALIDLHESTARERIARSEALVEDPAALEPVARQLQEYARGERRRFELELDLQGSEFELRVWNALRAIPWGETRTYGQIAAAIGEPGSARAVGRANGQNRVPIVVPCHRVVSAAGLGGFSGGLAWKQRLLALERVQLFA
jgi:methylated-DNA-[protein]-cysteine S-methyltransferase